MSFNKVLIIGAGTMGRGIAQWFAQQKIEVEITDAVEEMADKACKLIHASWDKLEAKGKFQKEDVEDFKKCLRGSPIETHTTQADLVIEAIIEDERIKRELFQKLDLNMNKECIITSNTSSIPITTLARNLSSERKKRMFGLHFFNPATIMKLVEIIETPWADKELMQKTFSFFEAQGKKPALCKDSPGFIVNRVARNFYGESLHILENHDVDKVQEIDHILTEVGGFKMGPFTLMDLIGIDINYDVTQSVWNSYYQDPRFRPHKIQREMVESGRIGKKATEGFYKYE